MRWPLRQIVTLVAIAGVPALGAAFLHPLRPAWRSDEVVVSQAQTWGERVIWVDSRSTAEFNQGHIPGAFSLSEEDWDTGLAPLLDAYNPDRIIVVYCSSLSCQTSHEVAKRLREEVGLKEVRVLQGGWESWKRP
jgi:rhodanese-related sulfurtransferase